MAKMWALCLALLVSGVACTSRKLVGLDTSDVNSLFGNIWIQRNGIVTRDFRCYLAQDADSVWAPTATASALQAKRDDFQKGLKKIVADYLQCNQSYISFPDSKLPARSWLRVPSSRQRDERSYIDLHIDYPANNVYNNFPKQITDSSAWLLGAGNDVSFVAKWAIGVTDCDVLDPDYAFTKPFPTGNSCDRTQPKCIQEFPLCTRCVEIFPLRSPAPSVQPTNLTFAFNAAYFPKTPADRLQFIILLQQDLQNWLNGKLGVNTPARRQLLGTITSIQIIILDVQMSADNQNLIITYMAITIPATSNAGNAIVNVLKVATKDGVSNVLTSLPADADPNPHPEDSTEGSYY